MSSVSFRSVTKRFGDVLALDDLTLDVEAGEFISLLGPSGSGKSTTLNLLAGLLELDEGEIRIGDRIVNDIPPDKRDVAMVFQNYALYPHLTVFENIAFPLRARSRRTPEQDVEARVSRAAGMLGLTELLARYPRELSGGQQQRVALGRAIVRDPKVFLLDEPLSNLDARLRIRMRHDLKALHDRLRSTIVYVTHDQAEAMSMSTRIAVFNEGVLQQCAAPYAIYNRPANIFVANFVGEREITFLEGMARIKAGRMQFTADGIETIISGLEAGFDQIDGRRVLLGIRAEGIRIVDIDCAEGVPASVTDVELSGPDSMIYARTGSGLELCARAEAGSRISKGMPIRLSFLAERLHVFDPENGIAIPVHG